MDKRLQNRLDNLAQETLRFLDRKEEVEIILVGNTEMEQIRERLKKNPDFKGHEAGKIRREKRVNVLAFPAGEHFPGDDDTDKLGEVYLNKDFKRGNYDVLAPLLIHGILHLLGYHHYKKRDTIKTEKLEERVCNALLNKKHYS